MIGLANHRRGLILIGLLACVLHASAAADEASIEQPATVSEALESMGSVPWYDPESGDVTPISVTPRVDDSVNRDSRWLRKPSSNTPQNATPSSSSGSVGQASGSWADLIGWVIVVILMIMVVSLLVYAFLRMDSADDPVVAEANAQKESGDPDLKSRLEKLPVDVRRPAGDLLEEADRLAAAGRLDEAIVYLFSHRLLQLDRHHAIRLARGKTNRQYLSELRAWPELRRIMRETVRAFEASYFGRYRLSQDQFAALRADQSELESKLTHLREAA